MAKKQATPKKDRRKKYNPKYIEVLENLFEKEGTAFSGAEVAKIFRVKVTTIYNWRHKYPDFRRAMDVGRDYKNIEVVENELLKNCKDRWVSETRERFNKDGDLTSKEIRTRLIPGDVAAQKFFLMSRDHRYSQVKEESTVSGGRPVEFNIVIDKDKKSDGQNNKKDVHSGADTSETASFGRSSTRH